MRAVRDGNRSFSRLRHGFQVAKACIMNLILKNGAPITPDSPPEGPASRSSHVRTPDEVREEALRQARRQQENLEARIASPEYRAHMARAKKIARAMRAL